MQGIKGNGGFSLVELMVAIAIMAVVGASIAGFITTSSKSCQIVSETADLQEEAQLAANQLETLLMNAENGIYYDASAGVLYIYNSTARYVISWDASSQTLHYATEDRVYDASANAYTSAFASSTSTALMAEYIDDFAVAVDTSSGILAEVTMHFSKSDKTYQVSQKVALRNSALIVSSNPADIYASEANQESVTTTYYGMTVQLGATKFTSGGSNSIDVAISGASDVSLPLSAVIKGSYYPSQSYSATLTGSGISNPDTKSRVSDDGTSVVIASGETSSVLTLTVISTAAPSLQCTITIRVTR